MPQKRPCEIEPPHSKRPCRSAAHKALKRMQVSHEYFVPVTSTLFISENLGKESFAGLKCGGVYHIASLIADGDLYLDDSLETPLDAGLAVARKILVLMKKDPGQKWIVHCSAGVNRASWICALILCLIGWEPQAAVDRIIEAKSVCPGWNSFEGESGQRFMDHVLMYTH
jgi:hypothetical protein